MNPAEFQQSISASALLLQRIKCGDCLEAEAAREIERLTSSVDRARGFFVALLSGPSDICDSTPPPVIVDSLRLNEDISCDLLARNVVMSTATALAHSRKADQHSADQSKLVALRASNLIRALNSAKIRSELGLMNAAIDEAQREDCLFSAESDGACASSKFLQFLVRWKYDGEQLDVAHQVIEQLLDDLS